MHTAVCGCDEAAAEALGSDAGVTNQHWLEVRTEDAGRLIAQACLQLAGDGAVGILLEDNGGVQADAGGRGILPPLQLPGGQDAHVGLGCRQRQVGWLRHSLGAAAFRAAPWSAGHRWDAPLVSEHCLAGKVAGGWRRLGSAGSPSWREQHPLTWDGPLELLLEEVFLS